MITTLICCTNFRRKIEKFIVWVSIFETIFYIFAIPYFRDVLHNETAEIVMFGFLCYHAGVGSYAMHRYFSK